MKMKGVRRYNRPIRCFGVRKVKGRKRIRSRSSEGKRGF
jgi:hypothetical protein